MKTDHFITLLCDTLESPAAAPMPAHPSRLTLPNRGDQSTANARSAGLFRPRSKPLRHRGASDGHPAPRRPMRPETLLFPRPTHRPPHHRLHGPSRQLLRQRPRRHLLSTLKIELIYCHDVSAHYHARLVVFEWRKAIYNLRRRHSSINNLSPVDFENQKN